MWSFFWGGPFFIISVNKFFFIGFLFSFYCSAWGNYDDFYDDYDDDDNDWDLSCLETGTTTASEESGGAAKVVVVPRVEQLLDTTIYKGPSAAEKEEEEKEKEKEEGEKQRKESSGAGAADAAASASAVVVVGESARVVDNYLQLFPGPAGTRLKVIILP